MNPIELLCLHYVECTIFHKVQDCFLAVFQDCFLAVFLLTVITGVIILSINATIGKKYTES